MAQDALVLPLPVSPAVAPGMGVTSALKSSVKVAKSSSVLFSDTTSVNLFEVPANILVTNAYVNVTSAFDASGTSAAATLTVTVPADTGATTIWSAANVALQATGFYAATGMELLASSGGFVNVAYTPGTTTAGAMQVFLEYVEI